MKKILLVWVLISFSGCAPAIACDSYESCMDSAKKGLVYQAIQSDALTAIAYKLNTIDKTNKEMGETLKRISELIEKLQK